MSTQPSLIQLTPPSINAAGWQPVIGQETLDLLGHFAPKLDETEREALQDSTVRILSRCAMPGAAAEVKTGLVVGYVQSGKTMSFTTVAALAADNNCPLIIVITGTTKPLFDQSSERLDRDLRLDQRTDRKWQHFREPDRKERERINQIFEDWRDQATPAHERQFVLITVKKNWSVLRKLITLLNQVNRAGIPALIIDDEADQASLNTRVRQQEESTTYARLLQLRRLFPNHTFLQYTATPQAPLLISILDTLSPDFAELLNPGADYVGGIEFFSGAASRIHPILDVAPQAPPVAPPESLIEAMRFFFVGVAAGAVDGGRGNRSMLIHPSRETLPQGDFAHWVRQIKDRWVGALELPETEPDYADEIQAFQAAYAELVTTVGSSLPSWDAVRVALKRAIRKTSISEVNSTPRRADVDWRAEYAWILVGGQALDRGFTVEGLTVTYMPRGLGTGNADTLQQRARFFGYKRRYIGFCRVYLDPDVQDAFTDYVKHEENVRLQLDEWKRTGRPVQEWKRAFLLGRTLQPTRRNVLNLDHLRDSYADEWFWVRSPHESNDAVTANRDLFDSFVSGHAFADLPENAHRTPARQHRMAAGIPLEEVYEGLLSQVHVRAPDDGQKYFGALLQIHQHLQTHPDALCTVYQISPYIPSSRGLDPETDEIKQLFMGSNGNPGDDNYDAGQRHLHADRQLSIQLHRINLTSDAGEIMNDVPVVAVWIPAVMANDWLVQDNS